MGCLACRYGKIRLLIGHSYDFFIVMVCHSKKQQSPTPLTAPPIH